MSLSQLWLSPACSLAQAAVSGCGDAYAAGVGVSIANLAAVGPDGLVDVLSSAFGGAVSVSQTIGDAAAVSQGIAIAFASELPSELTCRALFMAVCRTDCVQHESEWRALRPAACRSCACQRSHCNDTLFTACSAGSSQCWVVPHTVCNLSQVTYRQQSSLQTLHTPSRKSPALRAAHEPQQFRFPSTTA